MSFLGATLDAKAIDSWVGAAFVLLTGGGLFELCRRQFARQWDAAMEGAAP
jgi:branched-chain amino acid transport system permease protein